MNNFEFAEFYFLKRDLIGEFKPRDDINIMINNSEFLEAQEKKSETSYSQKKNQTDFGKFYEDNVKAAFETYLPLERAKSDKISEENKMDLTTLEISIKNGHKMMEDLVEPNEAFKIKEKASITKTYNNLKFLLTLNISQLQISMSVRNSNEQTEILKCGETKTFYYEGQPLISWKLIRSESGIFKVLCYRDQIYSIMSCSVLRSGNLLSFQRDSFFPNSPQVKDTSSLLKNMKNVEFQCSSNNMKINFSEKNISPLYLTKQSQDKTDYFLPNDSLMIFNIFSSLQEVDGFWNVLSPFVFSKIYTKKTNNENSFKVYQEKDAEKEMSKGDILVTEIKNNYSYQKALKQTFKNIINIKCMLSDKADGEIIFLLLLKGTMEAKNKEFDDAIQFVERNFKGVRLLIASIQTDYFFTRNIQTYRTTAMDINTMATQLRAETGQEIDEKLENFEKKIDEKLENFEKKIDEKLENFEKKIDVKLENFKKELKEELSKEIKKLFTEGMKEMKDTLLAELRKPSEPNQNFLNKKRKRTKEFEDS